MLNGLIIQKPIRRVGDVTLNNDAPGMKGIKYYE